MCGVYGNSLFLHHWCVDVCVVCLLLELLFKYTNMLSSWETIKVSLYCFPLWILHHFFLCLYRKTLWRVAIFCPFSVLPFSQELPDTSCQIHASRETTFVQVTNSYSSLFILCDWAAALITPFSLEILHSLPWYHSLPTFYLVLWQVLSPISQVPLHIIDLFCLSV